MEDIKNMNEIAENLDNLPDNIRKIYFKGLEDIAAKQEEKNRALEQSPMPTWGDDQRAITNAIARSAVFSASEHQDFIAGEMKVEALKGYEIYSAGKQLTQDHHDIFMEILHLYRGKEVTSSVKIKISDFLRILGKTDGTATREWLLKKLEDISQVTLKIKVDLPGKKISFSGGLMSILTINKVATGEVDIEIDIPLKAMTYFKQDDKTYIYIKKRKALRGRGSSLAKAWQPFIHSHEVVHDMKIDTICNLFGVKNKSLKSRKQFVKNAAELLIQANEIKAYEISETGLVRIIKK